MFFSNTSDPTLAASGAALMDSQFLEGAAKPLQPQTHEPTGGLGGFERLLSGDAATQRLSHPVRDFDDTQWSHQWPYLSSDGYANPAVATIAVESLMQAEPGVFTVGSTGEIEADFLFDSGVRRGEVGIFSLTGMEALMPGSTAYKAEAAKRALSGSDQGHLLFSDRNEGARFSGSLNERDYNRGDYGGLKSVSMQAGDRVGFIFTPSGTLQNVVDRPDSRSREPFFSITAANPEETVQLAQLKDGLLVWEEREPSRSSSTRDYNDVIFQVEGLVGNATDIDEVIAPDNTWRSLPLWNSILAEVCPPASPQGEIRGTKWHDLNGNGRRDSRLIQGDNPDITFVIDVSGSVKDPFAGSPVGDFNGDGGANTILDGALSSLLSLNQQLIQQGMGDKANVSIVVFGASAARLDMDVVSRGQQIVTTPNADADGNGRSDVEDRLRSITSGASGVGTATNFEAALRGAEQTFEVLGTLPGAGSLIMMTDGKPDGAQGSFLDEVSRLRAQGIQLNAFGVGTNSSLADIRQIDPDARQFQSNDELQGFFSGLKGGGGSSFLEPGLGGISIYLDLNNNDRLDANEPVQLTAVDDLTTVDVDETGQYRFTGLAPGSYVVREVVPPGFRQTFPSVSPSQTSRRYADVFLDYVSGGETPVNLVEPYGSNNGVSGPPPIESVDPRVILNAPAAGPLINNNPDVDWLSLPRNSAVTVGFSGPGIVNQPGDDIFIRAFDQSEYAQEKADVLVSHDGLNFEYLGKAERSGEIGFDLADIGFTQSVKAVKVVGLDFGGRSPGFDLIAVAGGVEQAAESGYHLVELAAGQVVEGINFGNVEICQPGQLHPYAVA